MNAFDTIQSAISEDAKGRDRAEARERGLHTRELPIGSVTPDALYEALGEIGGDAFLFETASGQSDGFAPTYSTIGFDLVEKIAITGCEVSETGPDGQVRRSRTEAPLQALRDRISGAPRRGGLPPFCGGLFGYFGFESFALFEPGVGWERRKAAAIEMPDVLQWICLDLVVFDHAAGKIVLITTSDGSSRSARRERDFVERCTRAIAALRGRGARRADTASRKGAPPRRRGELRPGGGGAAAHAGFTKSVEAVRDLIVSGDAMQVVLARHEKRVCDLAPLDVYRALKTINPSPYTFHLKVGGKAIVGSSPEMLVRSRQGHLTSRPMAGTRRRGASALEDAQLSDDLRADEKERAEHLMLIDLARNDLGRIAETGSVRVAETMAIERFSHVMHLVSSVVARKRSGIDAIDVIAATFPAGTLSGAPKIRAIEILRDLEPVSRGVYGGCVGFIDESGDLDQAIAIRTAVFEAGAMHLQAGAGIVFDSRPEREWLETIEKMGGVAAAADRLEGRAQKDGTHASADR